MSVFAYSIIGRGVFSAKYNRNSQLGENDTRINDSDFQGAQYNKNILIAEKLSEIGKKYGKSSAQVAIRWVLENSNITSAITGVKNKKQVSENVSSTGWSLDQSDMELIDLVHRLHRLSQI